MRLNGLLTLAAEAGGVDGAPKSFNDTIIDFQRAVLEMMTNSNTPHNLQCAVDRLAGVYTKTQVKKALEALTATGDLTYTEFSSASKVWVLNQETIDVMPQEELNAMIQSNQELEARFKELTAAVAEAKAQHQKLMAQPPTETLKEECARYQAQLETVKEQVAETKAQGCLTEPEADALHAEYAKIMRMWHKRRQALKDVMGDMGEAMEKTDAEIEEMARMEIEEDIESYKAYVKEFPLRVVKKVVPRRRAQR
ncbi:Tat binding protein 1-interacting protein [Kipferlia bialata]|uniref:Tat binding protein 1-interacting protein n=1 Tax=Kipferlia bialata TaxID=797122 RepID=A0A9K3GEU5_9EUKA|nr:Tat binding protein 1-interacting protein [Kipferlia bialata]|eukprot:g2291.t1